MYGQSGSGDPDDGSVPPRANAVSVKLIFVSGRCRCGVFSVGGRDYPVADGRTWCGDAGGLLDGRVSLALLAAFAARDAGR